MIKAQSFQNKHLPRPQWPRLIGWYASHLNYIGGVLSMVSLYCTECNETKNTETDAAGTIGSFDDKTSVL